MIAMGALRRTVRSEQAWTTQQEQKGVEEEEAEAGTGRSREGKKEKWKETNC